MSVPSTVTGRGVFQNIGTTRRQGLEASAQYRFDRWSVFAAYNFIDATFRDTIVLASPDNPLAVDGLITVGPGNRIPSIPQHRFKAGAEYALAPFSSQPDASRGRNIALRSLSHQHFTQVMENIPNGRT